MQLEVALPFESNSHFSSVAIRNSKRYDALEKIEFLTISTLDSEE